MLSWWQERICFTAKNVILALPTCHITFIFIFLNGYSIYKHPKSDRGVYTAIDPHLFLPTKSDFSKKNPFSTSPVLYSLMEYLMGSSS